MKSSLAIIFTFFISLSYAQPASWGYWKTTPLKSVQMQTPIMIKEKLSGTTWRFDDDVKWHIKKGVIWESNFIYTTRIYGGGTDYIIHIGENEIYQYEYFYFLLDNIQDKIIRPFQDNMMFFVGNDDKTLYLCKEDYRNDGKQFHVYKYKPCDKELFEQLEIYYCINETHFTILDMVNYPPIEITDILCPAPQNPNQRAELSFPEKGKRRKNK